MLIGIISTNINFLNSFERGFPQSLQDTDFLREKEEIKENYNSVKMLFRDTKKEVCDECKTKVCDKCAKEKMRHSWSKRSIIEMASRSGISAKTSYFAYAIPLLESHPSIHSIANRITFIEDTFEYRQIANPKNEIQTLLHAHYLLLHSLGVFADYFLLNEDEEFSDKAKIEGKSFTKVWNSFRM